MRRGRVHTESTRDSGRSPPKRSFKSFLSPSTVTLEEVNNSGVSRGEEVINAQSKVSKDREIRDEEICKESPGHNGIRAGQAVWRQEKEAVIDDSLTEYRQHLVLADQKAVEDFDKALFALSGGALGVSFAFLKDVLGPAPWKSTSLLFWAWCCWGFSNFSGLASYYFSHLALRRAMNQTDQGTIFNGMPGGSFTRIINVLNPLGPLLFLGGVALIVLFVRLNLGGR